MNIGFQDVIEAWQRDGENGGHGIHPLPVDSPEWWALGEAQAAQVTEYADPDEAFVIDFGCGYGRLTIPLVALGYVVLAVDASQAMLDGLVERATRSGYDVGHVLSDGSDLPALVDDFMGQRADVVISRAVLIHHDYAGVERLVGQLASVLRPGGILIADWPISDHPRERTNWTDVTTWNPTHRLAVGRRAGLEPVEGTDVWRKTP